jgi:hypothetical protein
MLKEHEELSMAATIFFHVLKCVDINMHKKLDPNATQNKQLSCIVYIYRKLAI